MEGKTGAHWNEGYQEFEVWHNGELIGYAESAATADRQIADARRLNFDHFERTGRTFQQEEAQDGDWLTDGLPETEADSGRECAEYGLGRV